jgi:hypothetical protein
MESIHSIAFDRLIFSISMGEWRPADPRPCAVLLVM